MVKHFADVRCQSHIELRVVNHVLPQSSPDDLNRVILKFRADLQLFRHYHAFEVILTTIVILLRSNQISAAWALLRFGNEVVCGFV